MPIIPEASGAAGRVDSVFLFIFALSAVFLVLITSAIIYFVVKYSKKRHPKAEDIEGNAWIEFAWTAIPTIIFLAMFFYGWTNFRYMREVPRDAMVIDVTGRQWAWSFQYPNAKRTTELVLAEGKPVKLQLHSLDVIHGFFIPAFRIKEDVVPGKDNYTWFVPTQLGSFDIECTVICGVSHANMLAKAVVVPVSDFEKWYFGDENTPLPGQVKAPAAVKQVSSNPVSDPAIDILNQRYCVSCHSIDGTAMVGPTFKGLYGKRETVTTLKGREHEVLVDEDYLARAIQDPAAETAKGYPSAMPKNPLSDAELKQVVAFIKNLR
jgi:cytochrome c oxidase subunit 2